jgi:hypothetical protein
MYKDVVEISKYIFYVETCSVLYIYIAEISVVDCGITEMFVPRRRIAISYGVPRLLRSSAWSSCQSLENLLKR